MAELFIGLYERVIRRLEALLASQPENAAAIQSQIDEYQQKIDILERFLAKLRQSCGGDAELLKQLVVPVTGASGKLQELAADRP